MRHPSTIALFAVILAFTSTARGAEPRNLLLNGDAEAGKNGQPSIWFQASVPADGLVMGRDLEQARAGKASLFIENRHDYGGQAVANNWGQSLQEFPAGEALVLSAAIKARDADAANVCLQCWDASGKTLLAFASTPVVRGDQEWVTLRSDAVVVPAETKSVIVRAALSGKGKVWFDDIVVKTSQAPAPATSDDAQSLDRALARLKLAAVGTIPLEADQMVLKYIEDWAHGKLDNIAVANNDGGVRTLFAWPKIDANLAEHRFFLAAYSRETRSGTAAPGSIVVHEVLGKWDEQTSWKRMPKISDTPAAEKIAFEPGNGWKLFDVTPVVRRQLKQDGASHGVVLRFDGEDKSSEDWSGYAFVSREGDGQWETYRPVLVVVK